MKSLMKLIDRIKSASTVEAHCDVPCGIYDPHTAQMAAHTVIRMTQLIEEHKDDTHSVARYTAVKEDHAERCKHEIRVLIGDYFKPEHIEKHPELHELVMKVFTLGSKTKQEVNMQASEDLLETINKVAEIFWETKGVETTRAKAPYPTEKETVYPVKKE
jgi:nickel superoxide dismutase